MHVPINVKSPNNISEWQMGFNSAFKGLNLYKTYCTERRISTVYLLAVKMNLSLRNFKPSETCKFTEKGFDLLFDIFDNKKISSDYN